MAWLLRRAPKSPEDRFAEEMIRLVHDLLGMKAVRQPDFALKIEPPNRDPVTMYLANVYTEAQQLTGEARSDRLRVAVLAMKPQPRPATWDEAKPKLLPAIRTGSFVTEAGGAGLVSRPFAPFLRLTCAIDTEYAMSFATDQDLAAWGVSVDTAMATAAENLGTRAVEVGHVGPIALIMGPDGYISSWLAAPGKLRRIADNVGKEVVAIVPHRDHLVLVDASNAEALSKVVEDTLNEYLNAPRQLSPVPFLVRAEGVEPWRPPDGHPAQAMVDLAEHHLANIEYGFQSARLQKELGDTVFVASYLLVKRPDGGAWSWATWVSQVTDGLLPRVDLLMLGDNDDRSAGFGVRWEDALAIAGHALRREPDLDPPRWRHSGWPDATTLESLRQAAVPVPPPPR